METDLFMKSFIFSLFIIFIYSIQFYCQWQPDVRLTNNNYGSGTSINNAKNIASYGNIIHVVWNDGRNGYDDIYYKRSTNSGLNWGEDIRLTTDPNSSQGASIAVSNQYVHVVWRDYRDGHHEIYYKRSIDGGITWQTDVRLTNTLYDSMDPSLALLDSVLHVVWHTNRDGGLEIYYKKSTNNGVNWGADNRLTNNSAISAYPSIVAYGSYVHVAWYDERDNNKEIYYKKSTNTGINWESDLRLTYDTANSMYSSISASGNNIFVAWGDNRNGNYEIYGIKSTNNGINWSNDIRLTNNSSISNFPNIVISDNIFHVVWHDFRDGNYEIYYKRSTSAGLNWESDYRLTNASDISEFASVCLLNTSVNIVWMDYRDNNPEIYYKQNPTGNIIVIPPPAPNLIAPLNNSTGQSLTPLMDWGDVTSAISYRIQITTTDSTAFSTTVFDSSGITSSQVTVPSGKLQNNTKYWWRVNAQNAAGAGPWSVVWNFRTLFLGIVKDNEIPKEFKLYQNYPNPFNPTTQIEFSIPKNNIHVNIIVYDVSGKIVSILVNEKLNAGTYKVDFNGESLASGVCFYKLETEGFVETKRMVILK
ncbi:MAG: T9SS C-terminal target domain-containing protein [Ignavibacteriae bacterium]|nr:MAG: T9SS C-terminal target domain-containing protein [Ignavibacteriota bacterium]